MRSAGLMDRALNVIVFPFGIALIVFLWTVNLLYKAKDLWTSSNAKD